VLEQDLLFRMGQLVHSGFDFEERAHARKVARPVRLRQAVDDRGTEVEIFCFRHTIQLFGSNLVFEQSFTSPAEIAFRRRTLKADVKKQGQHPPLDENGPQSNPVFQGMVSA
jgi:hypothetical protein